MWAGFLKITKRGKEKHTKQACSLFFVFPQKGTSRDEGALAEGGATATLSGREYIIILNKHPLVRMGPLRLSVCKGSSRSSDGSGRRNNGRRDCSNDRKGQRVAMNIGMEERLLIMSCGGDGLLYCRRNGYGWHRGGQQTSP